jgi:hypothetical protein
VEVEVEVFLIGEIAPSAIKKRKRGRERERKRLKAQEQNNSKNNNLVRWREGNDETRERELKKSKKAKMGASFV